MSFQKYSIETKFCFGLVAYTQVSKPISTRFNRSGSRAMLVRVKFCCHSFHVQKTTYDIFTGPVQYSEFFANTSNNDSCIIKYNIFNFWQIFISDRHVRTPRPLPGIFCTLSYDKIWSSKVLFYILNTSITVFNTNSLIRQFDKKKLINSIDAKKNTQFECFLYFLVKTRTHQLLWAE